MLKERKVKERAQRTTQIEDKNIRGACLGGNLVERMACKEYAKLKTKCSKQTQTHFLNDLLFEKDYRTNRGLHRDDHQPEYEAWRAERNRIDEDRISRQRTAEGNWRREWDNDKVRTVKKNRVLPS